ncbi:MAG TPA: response regulator [Bryobacteraceae bacterium]|nr:response regulator [Bryobacteraceae bacterium]
MAETSLRALIIESSESDCLELIAQLQRGGYAALSLRVDSAETFHEALCEKWDIILSEYLLPRFGALEALRILNEKASDIPFVVVSSMVCDRHVHAALTAGAGDFVGKSELIRLNAAVSRELRAAAARRERKHLEEQFRHAQRLEAVGRLAGGVAHDFNNLLTIISGYAELLLVGNSLDQNQRAALEEIRRAAQRGGGLTHRLLAFSRRQPMAARIIRLNELLVNMERMLRPLIGEDVELVTLPAAGQDTIKTDPGQLEQVIMNIVVNARDAMPAGGKLTIETSEEYVDESHAASVVGLKPGPYVVLMISDTGIGMSEETRSHVFEPFFTTKAPGKGTGLGLATAYGIVRQSGGAITLDSEVGGGTTITIHLPRVAAPMEHAQQSALPERPTHGCETILLVEDEPRVRKLIKDVLSARGYLVLEASRGKAAVRFAEAYDSPIHLAILDVVMPEMSGPEVGVEIARLRRETRLLYISGYTDEAIVQHGILESGMAFLQKPFLPDVLACKVREVLDAEKVASA